jgi:uncharacterized damage-inducible protein DinB
MNADAFRQFYNYHFTENRKLWETCAVSLTYEQFTQDVNYSYGSVRDQIVHIMNVDELWFSELRNAEPMELTPIVNFDDRKIIRAHWDNVEQRMQAYLAHLQDNLLFEKPIKEPEEDKDLFVWQVLLHVANHGTDHRAQLLRVIHDMGIETTSQDFIFYVYDHP